MEINNKEVSTTQITNYISIAGVIVMIAGKFGFDFQTEDIAMAIGSAVTIYGIVSNYWHRFSKGDVTLGGFRR